MGRILRFTLIGCGGLVAVVVVIGVLGALIGGGGQPSSPPERAEKEDQSRDGQAQEEQPGEEGPRGKIGDTLRAGDVSWRVTTARQATELRSSFGETKQGNFVIVDFVFTNNGEEATTLDSASLVLIDSEGRESEADPDTFGYIDPAKDIFLENVNPGVSKEGEVIYTVASDAHGFVLRCGDTTLMGDENAYFDLGF